MHTVFAFCKVGEGLPVVKIAELKDGYSAQTKFSRRTLNVKQTIDTGDLLFSWSGSPDTSLDAFVWLGGPALLNQHIFKVVSVSAAEKRLLYYLLKISSAHAHRNSSKQADDRTWTRYGSGHETLEGMLAFQ